MKNGEAVAALEEAFGQYVGARYAIALCNGTATLHTALAALGVKPGDRVAVPPLTMGATTIAVLHAGGEPVFADVDPDTWLMDRPLQWEATAPYAIPVALYGLHMDWGAEWSVEDAAQTLRPRGLSAFTSYSFQASKILALGEGGMLVTDDEELATRAREFSSLGYRMTADQPRIDPATLKAPTFERHHSLGWNYRMNDVTAMRGLIALDDADGLLYDRHTSAKLYREAIAGCSWIRPQHVPDGWAHDYWAYAVALESADLFEPFTDAIVRHGGERPYGAWRLTYQEPAFRGLSDALHRWEDFDIGGNPLGLCPVAESLQPRLVQFQTNDIASAKRNANAVAEAIREIG